MFVWREQLNKHLRAGERSGRLWWGDAGHPLLFDAQLSTNYPDSSAVLCTRWGSVSMERHSQPAVQRFIFLYSWMLFKPTSNTVQSLCAFHFYFGFAQQQHQLHSIKLQAILPPLMRLRVRPSNLLDEQFWEVEEKGFCTIHYSRIVYGSVVSRWDDCRCGINVLFYLRKIINSLLRLEWWTSQHTYIG